MRKLRRGLKWKEGGFGVEKKPWEEGGKRPRRERESKREKEREGKIERERERERER